MLIISLYILFIFFLISSQLIRENVYEHVRLSRLCLFINVNSTYISLSKIIKSFNHRIMLYVKDYVEFSKRLNKTYMIYNY